MHAFKVDLGDGGVGFVDALAEVGTLCRYSQNASAGGDQGAVVHTCTGVKDSGIGDLLDPVDWFSGCEGAGIAAGSENDACGWFRSPVEPVVRECAAGGIHQDFSPVALEAHHERLGFGISHADVEFEDAGAVLGHHESGIEKTGESGGADDRIHDLFEDVTALVFCEDAGIRVGAHASGIRALIVIEYAFVVLRWFEGYGVFAVA